MAKATPTIIRLTVSVVVDRDSYMKEYGTTDVPKKADLTTDVQQSIEAAIAESDLGRLTDIYTVDVL